MSTNYYKANERVPEKHITTIIKPMKVFPCRTKHKYGHPPRKKNKNLTLTLSMDTVGWYSSEQSLIVSLSQHAKKKDAH